MKSIENTNQKSGLLTIQYKKPNYEALKKEKNWEENAKPRLEALAKEQRHRGLKPCSHCGVNIEQWIYEDAETDRCFGAWCEKCYAEMQSEPINKPTVELQKADSNDWYSESKPIKILSWGGGMDSTVLILKYWNEVDEIIIADTGAEEIETYEYMKYLINQLPWYAREKITVLQNDREGNIDQWHFDHKLQPMPFANRQCTDKWKLRVIHRYIRRVYGTKAVFEMMVGINYDEQLERERPLPTDTQLEFHITNVLKYTSDDLVKQASRQKISVEDYKERLRNALQTGSFNKEGMFSAGIQYARNIYPLCEHKIGKEQEKEIYDELKIQIPPKSGCYFCPMKSKAEWKNLEENHPDLYENTVRIQENSTALIKIMEMSEKKKNEMRCSCSNGIYEDDEEGQKYEAKLAGRGF